MFLETIVAGRDPTLVSDQGGPVFVHDSLVRLKAFFLRSDIRGVVAVLAVRFELDGKSAEVSLQLSLGNAHWRVVGIRGGKNLLQLAADATRPRKQPPESAWQRDAKAFLRRLVVEQEGWFTRHNRYATRASDLGPEFVRAGFRFIHVDTGEWAGEIVGPNPTLERCVVWVGKNADSYAPAWQEGAPNCVGLPDPSRPTRTAARPQAATAVEPEWQRDAKALLRAAVTTQEQYYSTHEHYATEVSDLGIRFVSAGFRFLHASSKSWAGEVTVAVPSGARCVVFSGPPSPKYLPARVEGVPACTAAPPH